MGKIETGTPLSAAPFLFHVGKVDESKFAVPHGYGQNSRGYTRQSLIDRSDATDPITTDKSIGMLFRDACDTNKKSRVWRRLLFSAQCAV